MSQFEEFAKLLESLQAELERTNGAVLRALILMDMRRTLDAMRADRRKCHIPAADLEDKEEYLKRAS